MPRVDRAISSSGISVVIVIALILAACGGYAVNYATERAPPQSATLSNAAAQSDETQTVTFVNFVTTSITLTETQTTTVISTVSHGGLQLEVALNTTKIQYGGGLSLNIELFNPLSTSLSMNVSYSNDQNILAWNSRDFLCDISLVDDLFGFALYQGYYTPSNISSASSGPLLLTPEAEIPCPTSYQPNISQITFPPNSDSASVSSKSGTPLLNMIISATTEGCQQTQASPVTIISSDNGSLTTQTTMEAGFTCGEGTSLFGYWTTPPANESCSQLPTANETSPWNMIGTYCDLVSFPIGSYTVVAQDVWNQTIYAHFQVTPANSEHATTTTTSATNSSETCTPAITLNQTSTTEVITLCHTVSYSTNSSS
jgi:hypothetical protein